MSKYMEITESETLLVTADVTDVEMEALKEKVLVKMKQEGYLMRSGKHAKNNGVLKRVAAAALVLGLTAPTAVYAAGKFGLFDGLFGGKDTTPIEQYVESVNTEQQSEELIYQMENDDYSIKVDSFVFSEATDYGIVQFTVTDKYPDGTAWYNVATWDEWYRDWNVWDVTEIFAGVENNQLLFEVNGLMRMNSRCFAKVIDEQTTVCYLCFNDMKGNSMAESNLKLSVKESKLVKKGEEDELTWNQIMKLDVPKGESLPNYTWYNEDGEQALVLTSVDFWLIDAPESSVHGSDIILGEISVQMKDGSEYAIHSEKQKVIDWFYSTAKEEGIWRNFASVIDLEAVVSFTVDRKVFYVEDAVKNN